MNEVDLSYKEVGDYFKNEGFETLKKAICQGSSSDQLEIGLKILAQQEKLLPFNKRYVEDCLHLFMKTDLKGKIIGLRNERYLSDVLDIKKIKEKALYCCKKV